MPVFISLLQRLRKNRRWKAQGGKKKKNKERFCASLIEGWKDSIKGWLSKNESLCSYVSGRYKMCRISRNV